MNNELRAMFPITQRAIYLNHAAVSPPPLPTIQAVESQLHDVAQNGSLNYRTWLKVRQDTRALLASMIGARDNQLAFVRNTSDGLSTVANGLEWRDGDNIVTFRNEFPSNIYPWLRIHQTAGIELRFSEERDGRVDLAELCNLIDNRTRVVALSHVQYSSGFRSDLETVGKVARDRGALFVVDVIQSLGVLPIDVDAQYVDVAAAAGHKWLLTPEGIGILYLSERALAQVQPTLVGWTSVPNPEDYNNFEQGWNEAALAWETGTYATSLIYGLRTSLELLQEIGVVKISRYLEELGDYFCDQLNTSKYEVVSSREKQEKSQIISIRSRQGITPMSLFHGLRSQNIITAPRGNALRIAPHIYNTTDEIDRLIAALP